VELAKKRAAESEASKLRAAEKYKKQNEEKKNTIAEINSLEGADQKSALGIALYPIVSRLQPDKAGLILSILMESDVSTLLGYISDPPSIRGVIVEALRAINGPPASDSRPSTHTGFDLSSTSTSLGGVDPLPEGGHANVEHNS